VASPLGVGDRDGEGVRLDGVVEGVAPDLVSGRKVACDRELTPVEGEHRQHLPLDLGS